MTRSVTIFNLGQDGESEVAYLLPKEPRVDRVELTAETRATYSIPSGTRMVVFQYVVSDDVYVRVYTDSNLAMPSAAVATGEAPMVNPNGLAGLEAGDIIEFISASSGAVHIVAGG